MCKGLDNPNHFILTKIINRISHIGESVQELICTLSPYVIINLMHL